MNTIQAQFCADANWRTRPRVPLSRAIHKELKVAAALEGVAVGFFTDKIVSLGLEEWKKTKEAVPS